MKRALQQKGQPGEHQPETILANQKSPRTDTSEETEDWSEPWRAFNLSNVPGAMRFAFVLKDGAHRAAISSPGQA